MRMPHIPCLGTHDTPPPQILHKSIFSLIIKTLVQYRSNIIQISDWGGQPKSYERGQNPTRPHRILSYLADNNIVRKP